MAARGWRARCQKDPTEVQNEAPTHPRLRWRGPPLSSRHPLRGTSDGRQAKRDPSACVTVEVRLVREVPGGPGGHWTGGLAVKDCHRAAYPIYFAQCSPASFSPVRLLVGGDANAGVGAQVVGVWVGDDAVNRSDTACRRPRRRPVARAASHIRLGPATQRPTRSSTGQSRRRWRWAPRRRHARGGLDEAWLEGEKKEKHGVEGYCWEPLILGRCRVPISAPVTLGAGARGRPSRLGFGQRSLRGAPGMPSIRTAGMLAHQLMRHGVRWVVVGVGGRLAKSLNPPPYPPGHD